MHLVCPCEFRTHGDAALQAVRTVQNATKMRYAEAGLHFVLSVVNVVFICYTFHNRPERDPSKHLNLARLVAIYMEFTTLMAGFGAALLCYALAFCFWIQGRTHRWREITWTWSRMCQINHLTAQHLNAAGGLPHVDAFGLHMGNTLAVATKWVINTMAFSLFGGIRLMSVGYMLLLMHTFKNHLKALCAQCGWIAQICYGGFAAACVLFVFLGSAAAVIVKLAEVGSVVAETELAEATGLDVFTVVALMNQASACRVPHHAMYITFCMHGVH